MSNPATTISPENPYNPPSIPEATTEANPAANAVASVAIQVLPQPDSRPEAIIDPESLDMEVIMCMDRGVTRGACCGATLVALVPLAYLHPKIFLFSAAISILCSVCSVCYCKYQNEID